MTDLHGVININYMTIFNETSYFYSSIMDLMSLDYLYSQIKIIFYFC